MTANIKSKWINLLLVFTSLLGYLEWSGNSHSFLFQAESEIFFKIFVDPIAVLHPYIVIPMLGQMALLITLFQHSPSKKLTYLGIIGLGILLAFIAAIGIISGNFKITVSVIPFFILVLMAIKHHKKSDDRQKINK